MTADDKQPADNTSSRADDTPPSEATWWSHQSPTQKRTKLIIGVVVLTAAVLIAWHFLSGDDSARQDADIASEVKSSMQQSLDTDSRFSQFHLVVEKVDVVKQQGNQYAGLATVRSPKGVDHQVPIEVTDDGNNMMWHSEPGAFVWAAMEQLDFPAPASSP